jgi:UDP-glucose 4-epimerase
VLLVDSLIPEYGGNLFNIAGYEDKLKVNIADVRDEFSMDYLVQGRNFLFNLAGQNSHLDSMRDPYTDLEINCRAQLSILEACRKKNPGIKIVFTSTRQIYGKPDYLPVDERHLLHPTDVNGINKMAGEWYHILYNNVYSVRAVSLRLTNTYGPRMRVKDARQTFLGIWVRRLIEGAPLEIWGDGTQVRDFNYVDDVVEAMLLAAATDDANGQVYNLGSEETINFRDLAELCIEVNSCGSPPGDGGAYQIIPYPPDRKPIDIGDYYADYRRIRGKLGWTPKISLREGLTRTLDYYRQYRDHYW